MGSNKNTLIILAFLLLVAVFAYSYLSGSSVAADELTPISPETSSILAQINAVDLDFSILQNNVFKSLKNWTLPPLDIPIGKANPFSI